jgi:hypothetical protein
LSLVNSKLPAASIRLWLDQAIESFRLVNWRARKVFEQSYKQLFGSLILKQTPIWINPEIDILYFVMGSNPWECWRFSTLSTWLKFDRLTLISLRSFRGCIVRSGSSVPVAGWYNYYV